jgi:hypothetical protein
MKFIISLCLLFSCLQVQAQKGAHSSIMKVLKKNIPGKLFIFGKWNENGTEEFHLRYLGQVKTPDGRIFKFVNYTWHWGLAHRATSRLMVYNDRHQYLGNYYFTVISDLPETLTKGRLIFAPCDKKRITRINVTRGIPKTLFVECRGDIYSFQE